MRLFFAIGEKWLKLGNKTKDIANNDLVFFVHRVVGSNSNCK